MNQISVNEVLRELGMQRRLELLKILTKGPMRQKDLSEYFKISPSSLSRIMSKLERLKLVERDGGMYSITGLGIVFLSVIERLGEVVKVSNEIIDAVKFLTILPPELQLGLNAFSYARTEHDIYKAVSMAIDEIKKANSWCKYVCRILECNIFRILVRNYLRGVRDKMISTPDTLTERINMLLKAIQMEGLCPKDVWKIVDKIEIRVYDLPFQLGVIDGKIAFFQISKDRHSPAYISDNPKFVKWVNSIFDYFWERAKPVKIPFEQACMNGGNTASGRFRWQF